MIYVVSDIHGEYDLFLKLLRKINFSYNDEMIICGDIIDKGKDSVKLLKFIKSAPNFRCIVGNHEYEFLKFYWCIMQESPSDFEEVLTRLKGYFPYDGNLLDWETVDWLETIPFYLEEEDFICVHAGVPLISDNRLKAWSQTTSEQLVYDRVFKEPSVVSLTNKCVFFGHTPTSYITSQNKIIKYRRNESSTNTIRDYYKIHLDLGVWLNGVMGCFRVDDCKEFYVGKVD